MFILFCLLIDDGNVRGLYKGHGWKRRGVAGSKKSPEHVYYPVISLEKLSSIVIANVHGSFFGGLCVCVCVFGIAFIPLLWLVGPL
jgi:hypothetical protein